MLPKLGTVEAEKKKIGNVCLHSECEGVSGETVGRGRQHRRDLPLGIRKRVGGNKMIFSCVSLVYIVKYIQTQKQNIVIKVFDSPCQIKHFKYIPIFRKSIKYTCVYYPIIILH